ncbi:SRPBCC family protein [Aquimarina sp. 2201CG14-23]|uniref:SRPBCC family protein n=1 Tax=Aquimarina mycalae TaxID=3040073 RepID=UPI002477E0DE|nr:SRPBCC domain-containing protein [Aquimarina sp. 2201CG14-23]MDH7445864.1 SRPBCC domain-containing protein [Aquimarina sp. 2201CG14-23]
MKTTDKPITVEQIFNTSMNKVWSALTDVQEMRQWFFDNIVDFIPEVGFKTQFLVQVEDRKYTHRWEIIEVVPNQKISYTWSYEEFSGDGYVTFELSEHKSATKLNFSLTVTEDFPSDVPEFTRESCQGGWDYFIKERLKKYLE